MHPAEETLFWLSVFLYALTSIVYLLIYTQQKTGLLSFGRRLSAAAVIIHGIVLVLRTWLSGHIPFMRDYENALSMSFFMVIFYFILVRKEKDFEGIGALIFPITLLMLGYAATFSIGYEPLSPSLKTGWLYVHVIFSIICFSAFVLGAGMGLYFLMLRKRRHPEEMLSRLNDRMYRIIIFGVCTHGISIIAGSLWANVLWGSFWSWDPVETWSLVTFCYYALYLHVNKAYKIPGHFSALWILFGVAFVMITFWGINLVQSATYHLYKMF